MPAAVPAVLLIDDSEDDVFLFTRLLRKSGIAYSLKIFRDSAEALEYFKSGVREVREWRPDICFLDIKIPGNDGFDLLRWVRKHEPWKEMPIVVLSSSDEPSDVAQARRLGAHAYMKKFPPAHAIKAAVDTLGEGMRRRRETAPELEGYDLLKRPSARDS